MPIAVSTLCALSLLLQAQPQAAMDWKAVDRVLGRSGNLQGETYRVGFPRNDLHATVGAVTVRPALALGSWVAFKQTDDTTAMLMGDLVLVESEVGPVIDALQRGGIEQTALHNQLAQVLGVHSRANGGVYQVGENPRLLFMHFWGEGAPSKWRAGCAPRWIRWISSGTRRFGAGDEPPIQQEVVDDLQRPGNEEGHVDQRGL